MFVLRAAFWIAVIAVLFPKDVDSGLQQAPDGAAKMAIGSIRTSLLATLWRVKAEFAAQDRGRRNRTPHV